MWKRPLVEASLWEWWVGWRMKVRWWWWCWWCWWWWWLLQVLCSPLSKTDLIPFNAIVIVLFKMPLNRHLPSFACSTSIAGPVPKAGKMDSWKLSFPNVDETFCIWLLRFTLRKTGPWKMSWVFKKAIFHFHDYGRKSTYYQLTESFVKLHLLAYLLVVHFVDSYWMLFIPSLCSYRLEIFLWFPRIECLIIQAERRQVLDVPAPHLDLSPYWDFEKSKKKQDVGLILVTELKGRVQYLWCFFWGLLLFSEFFYCSYRMFVSMLFLMQLYL